MTAAADFQSFALKPQVEAIEVVAIRRALEITDGHRRRAADLLQISIRALFYKMKKYGLE